MLFLLSVFVLVATIHADGVFLVKRDANGNADLSVIDPVTGSTTAHSSTTFNYPLPLVETTADSTNKLCYAVTVGGGDGTTLYELSAPSTSPSSSINSLNLQNTYTSSVGFFDLQYNPDQEALYGISVVGRLGRVLSNFTLTPPPSPSTPGSVNIDHLVQMPLDWYVNASSFDYATNHYFALLNEFPSLPNATSSQKLVIADFSSPSIRPSPATIFDIAPAAGNPAVLVKFLAWSIPLKTLFGYGDIILNPASPAPPASQLETAGATLVSFNLTTGQYSVLDVGTFSTSTHAGPLVASHADQRIYSFLYDDDTSSWQFSLYDLSSSSYSIINEFGNAYWISAATWLGW